jgi:hypothetical protein
MRFNYVFVVAGLLLLVSNGCVSNEKSGWTDTEIGDYSRVFYLNEVAGKLMYVGQKGGNYSVFYDGRKIGDYDFLYSLLEVDGKLAFTAKKGNDTLLVYDGKVIGSGYETVNGMLDQYEDISSKNPRQKLGYAAVKGGKSLLVYDGVEYGGEYDYVGRIVDPHKCDTGDSRTSHPAETRGFHRMVNGTGYYLQVEFTEVNGKPAYIAGKDGKEFVVYDGKELGKQYDGVAQPKGVGSKLAYVASMNNRTFMVFGEEGLGKEYDYTLFPMDVGGKLAYTAGKNGRYYIVYDGREVYEGSEDTPVGYTKEIDGKPAYFAMKDGNWTVFFDGKEYPTDLSWFKSVGRKIVYVTSEPDGPYNNKYGLIYDGKQIAKEYDANAGFDVENLDGKLVYVARRNGIWYLVREN